MVQKRPPSTSPARPEYNYPLWPSSIVRKPARRCAKADGVPLAFEHYDAASGFGIAGT